MGKQGSPKSPRPESKNDNKIMSPEMKDQIINDQSIGRRNSGGDYHCFSNSKTSSFYGFIKNTNNSNNNHTSKSKNINNVVKKNNNNIWLRKHLKSIVLTFVFVGFLFLLDSLMVSIFDSASLQRGSSPRRTSLIKNMDREKSPVTIHNRLLNMAYSALIQKELNEESSNFWKEPNRQASTWKPCSDKKHPMSPVTGKDNNVNNGYILISANGGLNQQRVAICNAVAVASLLNATLVLPTFLYSSVWKDPSQFGDIYQEKHFIEVLKDEIKIIKEIPHHLKSVDIEAIGSLITDADLPKEATPIDYMKIALPRLLRNKIVHFMGFGNRLGFDPLPFELQRLRCKCNFHALKFVPKIQKAASLLVQRIRNYDAQRSELDKQLLGDFMPKTPQNVHDISETRPSKYLALHLRFEIDMVAYSLCEFGGGKAERNELQDYREIHFPLLVERLKSSKLVSPKELRDLGKCPLTPEEAGLVLAGLRFRRGTYIYLAGSHIYGGKSRMSSFKKLYPNLVTKETLLTPSELAPFQNFSSQLAALDFIACATADVFAMTDSGSQLSSLASGFRTYYGNGKAPNLRPNKKRLASILSESETIKWNSFEERVKKMIEEGQRVSVRSFGRSIYRQPRCSQCMCKIQ